MSDLQAAWDEASPQSGDLQAAWDEAEKPLGLGYAPLDVALNLGTGMAAQAYGGLKGLGTLVTGGGLEQASKDVEEAAQKYTWQPRGRAGEAAAHVLALPLEYATKAAQAGLGGVGELVGGERGRDVGELIGGIGVPAAATVFGGRAAVKAAPKMQQQVQAAFEQAKAQRAAELQAAKYPESLAKAPMLDAAAKAQQYGIAIDPYSVERTRSNSLREMVAGGDELRASLSQENKTKWTELGQRDLGLQETGSMRVADLEKRRAEVAAPYAEIAKLDRMAPDEKLLSDAVNLDNLQGLLPHEVELIKQQLPTFSREFASAAQNGFSGKGVIELVKRYREEASRGFNQNTVESVALAKAKRAAADALDNFVERQLSAVGNAELATQYRIARQEIAKTYTYEGALDNNTGYIDPLKIAKQTSEANPLQGIAADIGAIAGNMPEIAQMSSQSSAISRPRLYRSGIGGTLGLAAGYAVGSPILGSALGAAAGYGVGALARSRAKSPAFQRGINIQDYRPMIERQSFVGPRQTGVGEVPLPTIEGAMPLVPGSFAQGISVKLDEGLGRQPLPVLPDESPSTPKTEAEVMFNWPQIEQSSSAGTRPSFLTPRDVSYESPTPLPELPAITSDLLSVADDLPKGTKTLYEGAVDFMLRQDALNQPAMAEATAQFLTKAEDLRGKIQNAQGFWRNRYQAELDALSKQFAEGMLRFGVRRPQEAIGLQPMYEGSGPLYTGPANTPRLQIEKTKSLRDLMQ